MKMLLFFGISVAVLPADVWEDHTIKGQQAIAAGQCDAAEPPFAAALQIAEEARTGDAQLAVSLNNLATVFRCQGKIEDAADRFRRAVREARDCDTAGCWAVRAVASRSLGLTLLQNNDLFGAEQALKDSLAAHSRFAHAEERSAELLQVLAWVFIYRDRYSTAEELLIRAKALLEGKAADQVRFEVLTTLATVQVFAGRHPEADQAIDEASKLAETAQLTPQSLLYLYLLVADRRSAAGKVQAAESVLDRAEAMLPKDQSSTVALAHIAVRRSTVANQDKRHEAAERHLRGAIEGLSRHLAADHPEVIAAKDAYAATLRKLGRKGEAKRFEREVKSARRVRTDDLGRHTVSFRELQRNR